MRVVIFGGDSFTAKHFIKFIEGEIFAFSKNECDITEKEAIKKVLNDIKPEYIINFAGISNAWCDDKLKYFQVNVIGVENILSSIDFEVKKIILPSSASVYGFQEKEVLDESLCPNPINYYAISKLAMEKVANLFDLPIIITRPFNYTGVCHNENFVIPKIVKHFKEKRKEIKLGNIDVIREFNDVDFACKVYKKLMLSDFTGIVNIASKRGISLREIINKLEKITNHKIKVIIDKKLIRKEPKILIGDNTKLIKIIGNISPKPIEKLLEEMYYENCN